MDYESYVKAAAVAIDLPLDLELVPAVAADFERIADFARYVEEFSLDETVEAAPVFRP